jgi:hypothetical protein
VTRRKQYRLRKRLSVILKTNRRVTRFFLDLAAAGHKLNKDITEAIANEVPHQYFNRLLSDAAVANAESMQPIATTLSVACRRACDGRA